jgi:hypothetical protein
MDRIDRRGLLILLSGAAVTATIGSGLAISVTEAAAAPLPAGRPTEADDALQQAQFGPPPRRRHPRRGWGFGPRRRRWDCWWHRGRRVCGWRRW